MTVLPVLLRQPDLEFDGNLGQPDGAGQLCDCRIWFPKDAGEDACIEIAVPISPESPRYFGPGPLTLLGKVGHSGEVVISGVWIKEGPAQRWPARMAGSSRIVLGHVEKIVQRQSFEPREASSESGVQYTLIFGLTECKFISPSALIESSYTGDVKVSAIGHAVAYPALGQISFERHYTNYKRSDVSGNIYTSNLVANVVQPQKKLFETLGSVESHLDDVCLLTSLAARHRVLVIELRYTTPGEVCRIWNAPLKRRRPSPQGSFDEGLIDKKDFEDYFGIVAERFCSLTTVDQRRIREAIYPLVPAFSLGGVESEYLAMFSSLEGLMRLGKPDDGGGPRVVDDDRWKTVKRELKKAINSLGTEYSDSERDSFRRKLGELNRPPLQAAMITFLSQQALQVDDLWPIFGSSEMPGLSEIRNRLAHGDSPPGESLGALGVARTHLTLLLERCLLSALGFPVERSRSTAAYARMETPMEMTEIERLRRTLGR